MKNRVEEILCQYLKIDPQRASYVHERLAKYAFGDDPFLFDEVRDMALLERIERAVRELVEASDVCNLTQAAGDTLSRNLLWGPHMERVENGLLFPDAEMKQYVEKVGKPAASAFHGLRDHAETILLGVNSTKREIRTSDRSRKALSRMNLRGIQLVDAARDIWEAETGKNAPEKALNPATAFGKYLSELFDAFEVGGDPKAAFRAWVQQREGAL